ncbi:hypothetical protein QW060_08220 [Myroides ceti]|uniref:Uncharacterized protein n=1 Tax=Paenimyroides ceti TaxID=395087 RepID=A0ABT8CRI0_9FLAO|nr:hypothetical protein [Paenimyroides ceti]MDN3707119.1 hypothetical protein [Paenimyroides ceti]
MVLILIIISFCFIFYWEDQKVLILLRIYTRMSFQVPRNSICEKKMALI